MPSSANTLDGIMTDWNGGAEAIFGYARGRDYRQAVVRLAAADAQDDEMVRILERIRNGERIEHFETRRRRKDGRIIDVSLTISPLCDDAGRLLGVSKVARDITAIKRAQSDARDARGASAIGARYRSRMR